MSTPRRYFTNPAEQRRALEAVGDFFQAVELDLYDASVRAFEPQAEAVAASDGNTSLSRRADEAFRVQSFVFIYNELASFRWNVFRPNSPSDCWPAPKVFESIKDNFSEFAWGGKVNLMNFTKSNAPRLQSCLAAMRDIKPNKGYPIMTVSKFLHFYNPSLFPIYDTGVIYNTVLKGYFKADFRAFCNSERLPYTVFMDRDTIDFVPAYIRWASSLLAAAHSGFMQVFTSWLEEQRGAHLSQRKFDPRTIFARAFEYTVVGAAKTEG